MPELQKLADEMRPRGLELVTVMFDGSPRVGRTMVGRMGLHAPVLVGDDALRARMNVDAYPWTVIVDRTGKAVFAVRGARSRSEFKDLFEKHL